MALGYVRPARETDVTEIARIQLSTWRHAYASIVPQDVLDAMDERWLAEHWHEACVNPPSPAHQVFVAVEQSESDRQNTRVVGFGAVGPDEEEPAEASVGAVTEMLIEPRFGRRGHGSRLLSAAVSHWREHDITTVHAWVFARDAATLAFYKSAGWETDGSRRTLDMSGQRVAQLRLHCDVSEPEET
ncbi:MAG TPA: GNAT family N-acetyltransferase [Candidatus Stackebrandtia excrementipullorum]|nr:GNAT family N-acetyltransferase [Candidatus Stackebrandtia excrementipullorum]